MNRVKIVLSIVVLSLFFMIVVNYPNTITLELGVFSGSNWGVPSGESYKIIDGAIERFEKKYPGVKVKYENGIMKSDYSSWLSDKIVRGKEPDVFMVLDDDFNTLSSIGALANIDTYINHDKTFSSKDYYSSVLKAGTYSKHQYALPYECDPTLMFVNKTLLEECHIDMPDNDWTLEDYIRIGNESVKASPTELQRLVLRGRNKSYDSQKSMYKIRDYSFSKLRERYKKWTGYSFDEKNLISFGLADEEGYLTIAGSLIVDDSPVHHSRLFCTRWNGLNKSSGVLDALDEAEYEGSVINLWRKNPHACVWDESHISLDKYLEK